MKLFTIGVSKKGAQDFFSLLVNAHIQKVLDIRLNNNSQLLGFSKGKDLKYFCEHCHNIAYEHVPQLAPTEELLRKYRKDKDWPEYEKYFMKILKGRSVVDIFKKASGNVDNVCLLCSEPGEQKCHRRLAIIRGQTLLLCLNTKAALLLRALPYAAE